VAFTNVALHLPDVARKRPYALAVVCPVGRTAYTHITFQQLDAESDRLARGLHALGLRRGMRTVLMVPPSLPFFGLTFALFKLGAVIVLVDPGMGVRNLGRCLGEAEPEAFIGVRKAHLARRLLGWAKRTVRITVGVKKGDIHLFPPAGKDECPLFPDVAADETAAILFTSGSTGVAKGAVYTHGIFAAQVEALRRLYAIEPGEIDLATFPLFALFAPALGMTAVIPDMDPTRPARVDPTKIIRAVEDWGVTNLFGSPALLNTVSRYAARQGVTLPSLRRVISAGAPVPAAVIERVTKMLSPGARVFTPYGATECLPVASIGSDEILGETGHRTDAGAGVCVGRPVPEIDAAIIPISDEPIPAWSESLRLPAGQVGEIAVKGPFVTRAYYGRPEATRLAKIQIPNPKSQAPNPTPDGLGLGIWDLGFPPAAVWHRMGDVGYLDDRGRLWFCGRKAHRVQTADGTLFTIPCEAVFNTHPAVYRTALVGVGPAGAQTPVLCVELEPDARGTDRDRLTHELLELGAKYGHTCGIRTILYHPAFPVDVRHNAKIFREKLAAWAARRVPDRTR
jgi:acyl-CoA synthetase (AMP-forming)/AMP-acid ligase II